MLAFAACNGQPASVDKRLANQDQSATIVARRALVGPRLELLDHPVIRVEGGRIAAISSGPVPDGIDVIDAGDATLLPGFIDAHVHIGFHPSEDILLGGVTTVRDTGAPPDEIFPLAERSHYDLSIPLILAAGPMLTVPGGYPTQAEWAAPGTGRPVGSPDEARQVVRELEQSGAVVIKVALNPPVGPTLDGSTLGAIVDTAHQLGLSVTGHVYGTEQLDKALDAGVDELAHMLMGVEELPERTIERMVRAGMTVVPTLSIRSGRDAKVAAANLERFAAAGGRVIYGTDLGNAGPRPGIDRREIRGLSRAGFSALDIIGAATVDAAAHLGLEDRGSLEVGLAADIIAVAGDPSSKAKRLSEVVLVMREGSLVREP